MTYAIVVHNLPKLNLEKGDVVKIRDYDDIVEIADDTWTNTHNLHILTEEELATAIRRWAYENNIISNVVTKEGKYHEGFGSNPGTAENPSEVRRS